MTKEIKDFYYSLRLNDGATVMGLVDAIANDQATPLGQVLALIAARMVQSGQSMTPAEVLKLKTDLQGGQGAQVGINTKNLGVVNTNLQGLKRDTDTRFNGLSNDYVLRKLYELTIKDLQRQIDGLRTVAGDAKLEADEAIANEGGGGGTGTNPGGGLGNVGDILAIETINQLIGAGVLAKTGDPPQPILTAENNLQQQVLNLGQQLEALTGDHSSLKDAVTDWTIDFLLTRYEAFYFPPDGFDAGAVKMPVSRFTDNDGVQQTAGQVDVTEVIDADSGAVTYKIAHGLDSQFLFLEAFTAGTGAPAFINWGVRDPAVTGPNESRDYLWISFKQKPEPDYFRILVKARPEVHHTDAGALL